MKFAQAKLTPLHRTGPEHQALKSKMVLEARSNLVYFPPSSLERSFRAGLVSAAQVTSLIQPSDCLPLEGFRQGKVTFSPLERTEVVRKEPYQHFPSVFQDSPVRGSRRGYDAVWTLPKLNLSQELSPTDLRSPRRILLETTGRRVVSVQRDAMDRLSQNPQFHRKWVKTEGREGRSGSVEPCVDPRRTRNVLRLVKFPRRVQADSAVDRTGHPYML